MIGGMTDFTQIPDILKQGKKSVHYYSNSMH